MTSPFLSTKEACEFILNPSEKLCTEIPRGCRNDATFVLDTFVLIILMILKLMIMAPSVIMAARVNSLSWMMTVKCLA